MKKAIAILVLGLLWSGTAEANLRNLPDICRADIYKHGKAYILNYERLKQFRTELIKNPKIINQNLFNHKEEIKQKKFKCPSGSKKIKPIYKGVISKVYLSTINSPGFGSADLLKLYLYALNKEKNLNIEFLVRYPCFVKNVDSVHRKDNYYQFPCMARLMDNGPWFHAPLGFFVDPDNGVNKSDTVLCSSDIDSYITNGNCLDFETTMGHKKTKLTSNDTLKIVIYSNLVKKPKIKNEDIIKLEEKKKLIAEKKKKEEEKKKAEERRIAEEKKKEEKKQREEQEYRILVKKFGDQCKNNSLGSPEFNKCLNDKKSEEELRVKLEKEYLESLTPEERRAHICSKTFGFKKGSGNFKDCVFKIYATELELAKLEVERQLAQAHLEIAKAHREAAEARVIAAKAQGELQKAQIQATEAQAAASQQQAAASKAQAAATKQQSSMNLLMQGLQMLQPTTTQPQSFNTTCRWMGGFFNCW